jgi:hypothetical protein
VRAEGGREGGREGRRRATGEETGKKCPEAGPGAGEGKGRETYPEEGGKPARPEGVWQPLQGDGG